MKNKEIEELLKEINFFDGAYVLEGNNRDLLLSYIEQLENNRDKAIVLLEESAEYRKPVLIEKQILNILKGDSDE